MFKSFEIEREVRLKDFFEDGSNSEERLKESARNKNYNLAQLDAYYKFAQSLNYKHGAISKKVYLAHIYRMTELSLYLDPSIQTRTAEISLIHNILEVVPEIESTVKEKFGEDTAHILSTLTVDRSKQKSEEYKKEYYMGISKLCQAGRTVKILDKLAIFG